MRKLSEEELKSVQKAIAFREINAAELLIEIYDHYVTHLERFSSEDFEKQLNALNEKWSYGYCKKLQYDLTKNVNKSVRRTQWIVIKSYFSWPKMMITLFLIGGITLLVNLISGKMQLLILFGLPMIYLIAFGVFIFFRTHKKIAPIKAIFKGSGLKINSLFSSYLLNYLFLPIHLYNSSLFLSKVSGIQKQIPEHLITYLLITFCFFIYLHSLSTYEAWKIKSKTALI